VNSDFVKPTGQLLDLADNLIQGCLCIMDGLKTNNVFSVCAGTIEIRVLIEKGPIY
jgi:hypothetical protein